MTKQEKIQEAYGENWEKFIPQAKECALKNNGWISSILEHAPKNLDLDFMSYQFRPKSLQDIENNNGWIKIESEADLPNEEKSYWVVNDEKEIVEMEYFPNYKTFTEEGVTHYQPINKPLKPLY